MLQHRCPWCGEKISINVLKPRDPISLLIENLNICKKCKKRYVGYGNIIVFCFINFRYY